MITLGIILAIIMASLLVYSVPGLVLARGMYARQVREINSRPVTIVPPKPERPRITLNEMLHVSGDRFGGRSGRCARLDNANRACNCQYREDWVELKNAWLDYNEWRKEFGHVKNGVVTPPSVNMTPIYLAVIGWPLVGGKMFIQGGAKNIPDYRAIERMENDLKGLE